MTSGDRHRAPGRRSPGTEQDLVISDVVFAPGLGGFYYDDLAAIQAGATKDGERYLGNPKTQGFTAVRMPARVLRIGLRLSDGQCVWGDAMSVQYAGAANRDVVFDPSVYGPDALSRIADHLVGAPASDLSGNLVRARAAAQSPELKHHGFAYGVSQVLLAASANSTGTTMAETICQVFDLPVVKRPVPIYAQSGDERYRAVDSMVAKRVDILPHGLINSREAFGRAGETFLAYVAWVRDRVMDVGDGGYRPTLHFDVYGVAGAAFPTAEAMTGFLAKLWAASNPLPVQIESPIIAASIEAQLEGMAAIRRRLQTAAIPVGLVADEWCNELADVQRFVAAQACDMVQIKMPDVGWLDDTVAAVAICHAGRIGAFLGGSCTETDTSARYSVHLAMATQADQLLAKPGMGVHEGLMITVNEQAALLGTLHGLS
jgi:methylaspartate ammonia-lyase